MPSLKAWEQGSGAPAHRQVVQGPLGQHRKHLLTSIITESDTRKMEFVKVLAKIEAAA